MVPFNSLVLGWHPVTFSKQVGRPGSRHSDGLIAACRTAGMPLGCQHASINSSWYKVARLSLSVAALALWNTSSLSRTSNSVHPTPGHTVCIMGLRMVSPTRGVSCCTHLAQCTMLVVLHPRAMVYCDAVFELSQSAYSPANCLLVLLQFALASTLYLVASSALSGFARRPAHSRGVWLSGISNHLLAFTFAKAVANTLL